MQHQTESKKIFPRIKKQLTVTPLGVMGLSVGQPSSSNLLNKVVKVGSSIIMKRGKLYHSKLLEEFQLPETILQQVTANQTVLIKSSFLDQAVQTNMCSISHPPLIMGHSAFSSSIAKLEQLISQHTKLAILSIKQLDQGSSLYRVQVQSNGPCGVSLTCKWIRPNQESHEGSSSNNAKYQYIIHPNSSDPNRHLLDQHQQQRIEKLIYTYQVNKMLMPIEVAQSSSDHEIIEIDEKNGIITSYLQLSQDVEDQRLTLSYIFGKVWADSATSTDPSIRGNRHDLYSHEKFLYYSIQVLRLLHHLHSRLDIYTLSPFSGLSVLHNHVVLLQPFNLLSIQFKPQEVQQHINLFNRADNQSNLHLHQSLYPMRIEQPGGGPISVLGLSTMRNGGGAPAGAQSGRPTQKLQQQVIMMTREEVVAQEKSQVADMLRRVYQNQQHQIGKSKVIENLIEDLESKDLGPVLDRYCGILQSDTAMVITLSDQFLGEYQKEALIPLLSHHCQAYQHLLQVLNLQSRSLKETTPNQDIKQLALLLLRSGNDLSFKKKLIEAEIINLHEDEESMVMEYMRHCPRSNPKISQKLKQLIETYKEGQQEELTVLLNQIQLDQLEGQCEDEADFKRTIQLADQSIQIAKRQEALGMRDYEVDCALKKGRALLELGRHKDLEVLLRHYEAVIQQIYTAYSREFLSVLYLRYQLSLTVEHDLELALQLQEQVHYITTQLYRSGCGGGGGLVDTTTHHETVRAYNRIQVLQRQLRYKESRANKNSEQIWHPDIFRIVLDVYQELNEPVESLIQSILSSCQVPQQKTQRMVRLVAKLSEFPSLEGHIVRYFSDKELEEIMDYMIRLYSQGERHITSDFKMLSGGGLSCATDRIYHGLLRFIEQNRHRVVRDQGEVDRVIGLVRGLIDYN